MATPTLTPTTEPKTPVTGYPAAAPGHPAPAPAPAHIAYPYPYPAPPAVGIPYYIPHPFSLSRALFLRRLLAALTLSILMAGAVTFSVWLVLRPRTPQFSVTSASVSSFNVSTSPPRFSADFSLTLYAKNPNARIAAYYDNIIASVLYGYYPLAEASLPPFHQPSRNSTSISARMVAAVEYVDPDSANGITYDRTHEGAVGFELRFSALARFQSGIWTTRWNVMRVHCGDLAISFLNGTSTAGSMVGLQKSCHVIV